MPDLMPTLSQALTAGGEILMSHYGKLESIEEKSSIDLVTIADRNSEAAIKQIIWEAFPDHEILAEESGAENGTARPANPPQYRWIVDPLDGTTNFAHTMPQFAVSIAVEHLPTHQIVAAGVLNPYYKETFLAERHKGATLNGTPLKVSTVTTLSKSLLVTGFPYDRREQADHYLAGWKQFLLQAHGILRLGSAALDLCAVAAGRLDAFWEEKLHPWDTAAGWLIVEESSGQVTDFTNQPYSPYNQQILATNKAIHHECLEILKQFT